MKMNRLHFFFNKLAMESINKKHAGLENGAGVQ